MTPETNIIVALIAPLIGALVALALHTRPKAAARAALGFSVLSLVASAFLVFQTKGGEVFAIHAGNWKAPFGIVLVADAFSAIMLTVCQMVVLGSLIFCLLRMPASEGRRHLYSLILTLSLGANGAFLTGDLFNLYVWFEVLLLSSFALMAMVRGKEGQAAAWRYVVINLIASLLFLCATGLIYGKTGTLNFAELHLRFGESESSFLIDSSAALLFGAFGIKSALIPLAFWLPSSYPKIAPCLGALFAGVLTKVGLYSYYRVFGMVFSDSGDFPHREILYGVAILSMVGGVLGTVGQMTMRRILSLHIISQVGYIALALALFTPAALAAGVFYLAHNILVKANLFLVTDLVEEHAGSSDLLKVSGLIASAPAVALLFAVPAMSLAGVPPLSGFFAKFGLLRSALELGDPGAALAVAGVGLLTFYSMLKIWRAVFWGPAVASGPLPRRTLLVTCGVLAAASLLVGLAAEPLYELARTASNNLIDPQNYLDTILTNRP